MARLLRRRLARTDLIDFACYVDPTAEGYRAAHLRRIADKLEAVERGEIKRLFITCPPRHWKSSLVSEKFPAYFLGKRPKESVILTSHSSNLALGFSRNVRDSIELNPRYRELFPEVRVNLDFSAVHDWALQGAYRSSFRALGVGASATGKGCSLLVIDDPVADNFEAASRVRREGVWQWYTQTLRDRLDPGGAIVLVMSRWHNEDLAGKLLAASKAGDGEQWEELHMPAIDENNQALWPEKYPVDELEKIKKGVGSKAFAARFQGRPRADEGNTLDSSQFVIVDADQVPRLEKVVRSWDLAFSESETANDLSGAKLGRTPDGRIYILHIKPLHGRWPENKPKIITQAHQDGKAVRVTIEANGTQLGYYQDIQSDSRMAEYVVSADKPEGDKEMRASMWGSRMVDGLIHCVRGDWNGAFFDQCDQFGSSDKDDMVDAVSAGYKNLTRNRTVTVGGWRVPA